MKRRTFDKISSQPSERQWISARRGTGESPLLPEAPYLPGHSSPIQRLRSRAVLQALLTEGASEAKGCPSRWQARRTWRLGVHFFEKGFYWEAHEIWEHLWRNAPPGSERRELLQVLLQYAASALHWRCGRLAAARRLAQRARQRLDKVMESGKTAAFGLDLKRLAKMLERYTYFREEPDDRTQDLANDLPQLPFIRRERAR